MEPVIHAEMLVAELLAALDRAHDLTVNRGLHTHKCRYPERLGAVSMPHDLGVKPVLQAAPSVAKRVNIKRKVSQLATSLRGKRSNIAYNRECKSKFSKPAPCCKRHVKAPARFRIAANRSVKQRVWHGKLQATSLLHLFRLLITWHNL